MKKNKMMRAAGALMVVTLLTTSLVSGTFAKYTTSGSATDSARVAKFGVTVVADGTLFDENYFATTNTPAGTTPDGEKDGVEQAILTVESSASGEKVVAPGTKNDTGLTLALSGKPEVDVQVAYTVNTAEEIFLDDYYPVKFTLKKGTTELVKDGKLSAVKTELEKLNVRYDANTVLSTTDNINLTWKWDFEDSSVTDVNKKDTALGDLAAGVTPNPTLPADTDYSTNTSFAVSVSVTQID